MTSTDRITRNFSPADGGRLRRAGFSSGSPQFALIIAMFAVLAMGEYLFFSWSTPPRRSAGLEQSPSRKSFILSVKGFETTRFAEGQKIRLKIGSVLVAPRKFFVFNIQPFNEVLFEDFSVDYFRQPEIKSMSALSDIQQALLPADRRESILPGLFGLKTGVITRAVIRGFRLTVYEGDEIKTVVKAAGAELDLDNKKMRLEDAVIEQHEARRIVTAKEAVLRSSDGSISIPGRYVVMHPEGVLKGSGVKIGL